MNAAVGRRPYSHSDHAGNRGDVVKQPFWWLSLTNCRGSLPSCGGLSFCDAFSGAGEYQLS